MGEKTEQAKGNVHHKEDQHDHWFKVVEAAIEYAKENLKSVESIKLKDYTVEIGLVMKGFRNAWKAPKGMLASAIAEIGKENPLLRKLVVRAWVQYQTGLEEEVKAYITKDIIQSLRLGTEQIENLAQSFVASHSSASWDQDDVILMMKYVIKNQSKPQELTLEKEGSTETVSRPATELPELVPTSVEEGEGRPSLTSEHLSSLLKALESIPAESENWDEFQSFLDQSNVIWQQKLQKRNDPKWEDQFKALLSQCLPDLRYFGYPHAENWMLQQVEPTLRKRALELLTSLVEKLGFYHSITDKRGNTIEEDRKFRNIQAELEAAILHTLEELAGLFPVPSITEPVKTETGGGETSGENRHLVGDESEENETETQIPVVEVPPTQLELAEMQTPEQEPAVVIQTTEEGEITKEPKAKKSKGTAVLAPTPTLIPEVEETKGAAPTIHLLTTREAADLLVKEKTDSNIEAFFWALIHEDELPSAYWLSRSLDQHSGFETGESALIACLIGTRWLGDNTLYLAEDLKERFQEVKENDRSAYQLLRLAAAMKPAIYLHPNLFHDWLKVPESFPELHPIVNALLDFSQRGFALQPGDLEWATGKKRLDRKIQEAALEVECWLTNAPTKVTKFAPATQAWRALVGREGVLRKVLLPAAGNQIEKVAIVRKSVEDWLARDFVEEQFQRVVKEVWPLRTPKVVGDPLAKIIKDTEQGCQKALSWCKLVEIKTEGAGERPRISEQVRLLRQRISESQPDVYNRLRQNSNAETEASSRCVLRSLANLCTLLDLDDVQGSAHYENKQGWMLSGSNSLSFVLGRDLLLCPSIEVNAEMQPYPESYAAIPACLAQRFRDAKGIQDSIKGFLDRQDFRFVDTLLTAIPDTLSQKEFRILVEEARAEALEILQKHFRQAEDEVSRAMVDGLIDTGEKSRLESILQDVNPASYFANPVSANLNFALLHGKLDLLLRGLDDNRNTKILSLTNSWRKLEQNLKVSKYPTEKKKWAVSIMEKAFQQRDCRIIQEKILIIEKTLHSQRELPEDWLSEDPLSLPKDFLNQADKIVEDLSNNNLLWYHKKIKSMAQLSTPRLKEIEDAFNAWISIKKHHPRDVELASVGHVLRFLGFTPLPAGAPSFLQLEGRPGETWIVLRANMSAGDLSPVPHFGSDSGNQYKVMCFFDRPGGETIASRIRSIGLTNQNLILLYLEKMKTRERLDILHISHSRRLTIAVLDEVLLAYLAQQRKERLPVFFRCALPFTLLNPYVAVGNVSEEMFFGREEDTRQLQEANGPYILFGGRQLGKSALLRHVQRRFNNPDQHHHSFVLDIKAYGDPNAVHKPAEVLEIIRDALKERGLLSPRNTSQKTEEIQRQIVDAFKADPHLRVLALLDEVDNFLEADAQNQFSIVSHLRGLMDQTGRRFKFVLAGLHNVQRFNNIPNQPLAQLGRPIAIGPMEPLDALHLIQEPLKALGFIFQEESDIWRIFSYTNLNPGLIQLFCHELVRSLWEKKEITGGRENPPYKITHEDVEAIYRKEPVQDEIRKRWLWTLALDKRYQAIAWALIVDQLQNDSYDRQYSHMDIDKLAHEAWPKGFQGSGEDSLRGLLEEMVGLGVLTRDRQRYRLLSPNLVPLMGSLDDIFKKLIELAKETPDQGIDRDHLHTLLDERNRDYSPLTNAQERSLNPNRSGLRIVLTCSPYEVFPVRPALSRLVPPCAQDWKTPPSDIASNEQMEKWLVHSQKSQEGRLLLQFTVDTAPEELAMWLQAAISVCANNQAENLPQFYFLFDGLATWNWLLLNSRQNGELETQAIIVTAPRCWSQLAIKQLVDIRDLILSDEMAAKVYEVTGGWPFLLKEFWELCAGVGDVRQQIEPFRKSLHTCGDPLRERVITNLQMDWPESVHILFNTILRDQKILECGVPLAYLPESPELAGIIQAGQYIASLRFLERFGIVVIDSLKDDEYVRIHPTLLSLF